DTLETSREGRADVIAMAECQRDSEALTMPSAASSAIQTVMVTLTGANNEPGFNNDSGVVVTADEDNAIGNSSEQDVSDNLSVSALVAGRLSAG
ncbi:MAG: hypothetical protein GY842_24845, partial [bacterium]|nr:hypothetical protein [bacterium]